MTAYLALLRGINLGSRNKIAMGDLRELLAAMGHGDVRTHLQTGNAIFTASGEPPDLAADIEKRVAADLGVSCAVLVLTQAELAEVVARNPLAVEGNDPSKLHVTFLAGEPDPDRIGRLDGLAAEGEAHAVVGRAVYLYAPHGYGRTKLSNTTVEKRLGVAATTRTWRVVTTLDAMMKD
jgi:uncharacterized protein (DUF1697 family)